MRKTELTPQLLARADRVLHETRANRASLERLAASFGEGFQQMMLRDLERAERQAAAIVRRAALYAVEGGKR